jgi:hypothetical protein
MDARELSIQAAIGDYNAGVYTSLRAVAKAYHVPRSTLQGRLGGASNSALSHQHQQRLTPAQEDFLVDWILDEDARACPPSHARAREMANRILRMNGDTQEYINHLTLLRTLLCLFLFDCKLRLRAYRQVGYPSIPSVRNTSSKYP